MKCQRCKSVRTVDATAKCAGTCVVRFSGLETEGTIPDDLGIGGGDYLKFSVCLDCGQMQGQFPVPQSYVEKDLPDEDIVDFFDNHFVEGDLVKNVGFRSLDPIIKEARDLHPKFGKFVEELFDNFISKDVRTNGKKQYKYPKVTKFVQMFRTNNLELEPS